MTENGAESGLSMDDVLAPARRVREHHRLRLALARKTAELERLRERFEDQTRRIQEASHELKNPLTVVCGYSAFLLRHDLENYAPEDLRRSLASIYRNAERLSALIEALVASSRPSLREDGPCAQDCALSDIQPPAVPIPEPSGPRPTGGST